MNGNTVSANEIISRVRITQVYFALGGPRLRSRRGQAFWRKGDGYNVALDDRRNTFHDFARGEGGGVLDLIQLARGGARKDGLQWLADFAGVPLDHGSLTTRERRESERQRAAAELEARRMLAWKRECLEVLRWARSQHLGAYHRAKRYVIQHGADRDQRLLLAFEVAEICEEHYRHFESCINRIESADASVLFHIFRRSPSAQGSLARVHREDEALRVFVKILSERIANQEPS
jgi:hypothetical protein